MLCSDFVLRLSILMLFFLSCTVRAESSEVLSSKSSALSLPQLFWSGDLRYRIAQEKEDIDDLRTFQQLRARLGFKAQLDDELAVRLRLATGTSAISGNQTLGDSKDPGMARRSFGLDLAFIDWQFDESAEVWAGRFSNPFWSPNQGQLVFSSELAFEGLALKAQSDLPLGQKIFFNLGGSIVSENYDTASKQDVVDTGILGAQITYFLPTDWGNGSIHYGYFSFLNIQDKLITSISKDAQVDSYSVPYDRYRGNIVYRPDPVKAEYFFQDQFVLEEIGAEWAFISDSFSATVFFDSVVNKKADDLKNGSEYGLSLKYERTSLSYKIVEKQAESAVGAFTDAYSNGGGTDNKGTCFSLGYQLSKNSFVNLSQFQATRGLNSVQRKYSASYIDMNVVF